METWKAIEGYDDYQISNYGRVKSTKRNRIKILKENENHRGYLFVRLYIDSIPKHFFIHRLVALSFIPNPENKPQVNHKDGMKRNNRIENLEWSTNGENQIHAHETGLKESPMKGKFGKDHNKSKAIIQILNGIEIAEFGSAREAERTTNIPNSNIIACCKGRNKTAGGFVWKYKGEEDK